jgi:hypothetical protein
MNFKEIESNKSFDQFHIVLRKKMQKDGHFLEFSEIPRIWNVQDSYGKSPFLMGKSTINGHFQ